MPTLPDYVLTFINSPLLRIFRVISGFSFLIMLGKLHLDLNVYVFYLSFCNSILFTLYHFILLGIRIKHIYKLINSDALDITN